MQIIPLFIDNSLVSTKINNVDIVPNYKNKGQKY